MRATLMGGLAGLAALALVAAPATAESTLKIVMHSDLKIVDPIWASVQIARSHGYLIYDTLFALDADLKPRPQMVERHDVSADGLTYTFTLRDGLAWHDGAPVTAEDCVTSLKRWGGRDSIGQRLMANTASLEAIDARSFRLVLNAPYGLVLESLAKPGGIVPFMMPKRVAETPFSQQIKETVGSGPFLFKGEEWRPGAKVVYGRNGSYRPRAEPPSLLSGGKVAKLDRVEWIAMPDPQTALSALSAGEVDANEALAHDLLPLVESDKNLVVTRGRYPNQYTLRPNWLHQPFNAAAVREAVGYALEQTEFLQAAVGNPAYYRTCKTYFVCGTTYATEAGTEGRLQGDAAKARAMLQAAGYQGTPVIMLQATDVSSTANLAPVAKAQLERAGFKVEIMAMDWQTHVARALRRDPPAQGGWNIILSSWGMLDVADPISSLFLTASCDKASAGWPCDEGLETLRATFAREPDAEKRKPIAAQIQARALSLGTHFPLGEWYSLSVHSKKVSGWISPPGGTVFWNVERRS